MGLGGPVFEVGPALVFSFLYILTCDRYEVDPEVDGWWKDFGARMSSRDSEDRRMSGFMDLGAATTTTVVTVEGDD